MTMPNAVYICVCNYVKAQDIEDAVRQGARSFADIQGQLDVSVTCGACRSDAQRCLAHALEKTLIK